METDLIIVREYCQKSHVDPLFIVSLEEDGLIDIQVVDGERYLLVSQLQDLERFVRWHEDLSVNTEGIGVIHELMERMHEMQQELKQLRREVRLYNPQIQISAESETKRSIFREKDKTKRSKKESAQHSKSRNKSFVMTSVSAL